MNKIKEVHARQLIDCKCRPMVEVDIITDSGYIGSGSSPTGSSVGMYESLVLRDDDPNEWQGLSVHHAVNNVNQVIAPALIGHDIDDLPGIDQIMQDLDGTPQKRKLGGNAIYSTSIAALRAAAAANHMLTWQYIAAKEYGRPIQSIPVPSFNVVNGGKNAGICQAFNEFLINPYGASSINEAVEISCRVFSELDKVISAYTGHDSLTGRSYGYCAPSEDPRVVLQLIQKAIDNCGYNGKVCFALDCASSEMYNAETKTYYLDHKQVSNEELVDYMQKLTSEFPFLFVEDLLDENDWDGFCYAKQKLSNTIIIGDDLIATTPSRLKYAYDQKAVDGFILKPNQVGTITEAMDTYHFAKNHHMFAIPSGRAGGVIGDIVMDLAVGLEIPFIKNGAPRSGERIDKLNFLMRVADLSPECKLANLAKIIRF